MPKFCSNCGTQLDDNARFCNNCGTQIDTTTTETTADPQIAYQTPQQPTPKKPNKKKILIAVIATIVAIGAIIGILFATGVIGGKKKANTAESVANSFMSAISNGDKDAASKYFAPFIDQTTVNYYINNYIDLFEYVSNTRFAIGDVENYDDEDLQYLNTRLAYLGTDKVSEAKEIEMELTYTLWGYSDTTSLYIVLIKYNGEWKIFSVQ